MSSCDTTLAEFLGGNEDENNSWGNFSGFDWANFTEEDWTEFVTIGLSEINYRRGESKALPDCLAINLISFLFSQKANPTGIWADYNAVYASYEALVHHAESGLIPLEAVPSPPSPSDYTDLESEGTLLEKWNRPVPYDFWSHQTFPV